MRRLFLCALAGLLVATPSASLALSVNLNQSAKVRLGAPARNVVVANPAVADVSLLGPQDLVIIGKGYGSADVVVTDAHGRTLFDQTVTVRAGDSGEVALIRGRETQSFACAPHCVPLDNRAGARP